MGFLRADASADGGEGGVFTYYGGGSCLPFVEEGLDEAGDVDVDGASAYAAGLAAVEAAASLAEGFFFIIA